VDAMLRLAAVKTTSPVPAGNLIELLDHVALHRNIGRMRSSAGRLRRDDILHKPLADSIRFETAIAWRTENRNSQSLSCRES
jgi:hypothetical protein